MLNMVWPMRVFLNIICTLSLVHLIVFWIYTCFVIIKVRTKYDEETHCRNISKKSNQKYEDDLFIADDIDTVDEVSSNDMKGVKSRNHALKNKGGVGKGDIVEGYEDDTTLMRRVLATKLLYAVFL